MRRLPIAIACCLFASPVLAQTPSCGAASSPCQVKVASLPADVQLAWQPSSNDEQIDGFLVELDGVGHLWSKTRTGLVRVQVAGPHTIVVKGTLDRHLLGLPSVPPLSIVVAVDPLTPPVSPTTVTITGVTVAPTTNPNGPTTGDTTPAAMLTDSFDGPFLTSAWAPQTSTTIAIANGRARSANGAAFVVSTATVPANQFSAGQLFTAGGGYWYVSVRASGTQATQTGYALACTLVGSPARCGLVKIVNGAQTVLAPPIAVPYSDGDVGELAIVGSTLTAKVKGQLILTATDTTIPSGAPGFGVYGTEIDGWRGGAVTP